ncbi:MAG: MscL family protein, partial [Blastocatellia bacterium]|nr:MscL family protein [Blastocatellia bacterium]
LKKQSEALAEPPPSKEELLLTEIRDLVKERR